MKKTKQSETAFLVGKRIILRPPEERDIELFIKWFNDPDVRQFVTTSFPVFLQDEKEWLEKIRKEKDHSVVLVIETKEGIPIGTIGLHQINWIDRTATTGAVIGNKKYWSRGYGSEAKLLLLEYAFNTLNLRKICSSVFGFNKRSQAYNLKCGYHVEGRKKAQRFRNGKYHDEILMAIFKSDWKNKKR